MIFSLAVIILLGLLFNYLFEKLQLPGLLGMLILGIIIGPHALNLLDPKTIKISGELRKIALIVILLRAGLGISRESLKRVGKTALKLSFLPGLLEGFTIAFISIYLLNFSFVEGGILGFIIAAVSPAVVVPLMLKFMDKGIGTNKSIPTLILASASIDDVFAITIFGSFLGLYGGNKVNLGIQLLSIPLSIIFGVGIGALLGYFLAKFFNKSNLVSTKSTLVLLGFAFITVVIEEYLKSKIAIAGLLGVMTIGFMILEITPKTAKKLSFSLNKIWVFAEIILFVLVGAEVDVAIALNAGVSGIVIITLGLLARSIGVMISTLNTKLTFKERLFCVVAYTPKATVQAAIGAIPLGMGIASGEVMLALAVMAIILTAPLGAIAIKIFGNRWLAKDTKTKNLKKVCD